VGPDVSPPLSRSTTRSCSPASRLTARRVASASRPRSRLTSARWPRGAWCSWLV